MYLKTTLTLKGTRVHLSKLRRTIEAKNLNWKLGEGTQFLWNWPQKNCTWNTYRNIKIRQIELNVRNILTKNYFNTYSDFKFATILDPSYSIDRNAISDALSVVFRHKQTLKWHCKLADIKWMLIVNLKFNVNFKNFKRKHV